MRGQFDKLQLDLIHLEEKRKFLERIQDLLQASTASLKGDSGKFNSVEMMVNAQESERQKLSRQMHDGPAQALSNFILQTEIALRLMDIDESQARKELNDLKSSAMNTFQNLRNFIFELRPMMLDDLGVVPTIRRYADTFKEQTRHRCYCDSYRKRTTNAILYRSFIIPHLAGITWPRCPSEPSNNHQSYS